MDLGLWKRHQYKWNFIVLCMGCVGEWKWLMGLGAFGPKYHFFILNFIPNLSHQDSQATVRSPQPKFRFWQGLAGLLSLFQSLMLLSWLEDCHLARKGIRLGPTAWSLWIHPAQFERLDHAGVVRFGVGLAGSWWKAADGTKKWSI